MGTEFNVVNTDKTDNYGRPIRRVKIEHVPSLELVLDPMAKNESYTDADSYIGTSGYLRNG